MNPSAKQSTLQATWERLMTNPTLNRAEELPPATSPSHGKRDIPPTSQADDARSVSSSSKKLRSSPKPPPKPSSPAPNESVVLEDSEDSDEDPDGWEEVKRKKSTNIPFPDDSTLLRQTASNMQVISARFNMVIKHPLPCLLPEQMSQTMRNLTQMLKVLKEDSPWQGYPVLIPWKDDKIYKTRALPKFVYSQFHENRKLTNIKEAKMYLSTYIHKWSGIQRKTSSKTEGEAIKYFQIQVAWIFDTPVMRSPVPSVWHDIVKSASEDIPGLSLRKCATQAMNPVVVIQFLSSAIHPAEQWESPGHSDCTQELHTMLQNIIGPTIEIGLVTKRFDNGSYSDKNPMVCMVECDKKDADVVQKDLVRVFSRMDSSDHNSKKARIQNGIFTNWIATPTFSSVFTKTDTAQLAHYAELMAKEKQYRKSIHSIKVEGVRLENLDKVAPEEAHLSPHVLLQLENKNIEYGDSPIRHLIFDVKFKERHMALTKALIDAEHPDSTWDEATLSRMITQTKPRISWEDILSSLANDGIHSPLSSLPVSNPSPMTLRQKLLSLSSRRFPGDPVLIYESVTVTDDGSLLLVYRDQVSEEALNVAKLLPLFTQHEMHIDPLFFCSSSLLNTTQGGYYNPLTRSGHIGLLQNTALQKSSSKKTALPEFCRSFTSEELVKVFKCPLFYGSTYANTQDDDLLSLANTIVTSPNPFPVPDFGVNTLDILLQETKLIQTDSNDDNVSAMSNSTFDSKISYNAFQIDSRAQLLLQTAKLERMSTLAQKARLGTVSTEFRDMACELGGFSPQEFSIQFPQEYHSLWPSHSSLPAVIQLQTTLQAASPLQFALNSQAVQENSSRNEPTEAQDDMSLTSTSSELNGEMEDDISSEATDKMASPYKSHIPPQSDEEEDESMDPSSTPTHLTHVDSSPTEFPYTQVSSSQLSKKKKESKKSPKKKAAGGLKPVRKI